MVKCDEFFIRDEFHLIQSVSHAVSESTQPVNSPLDKVRKQSDSDANHKADGAGKNVWRPCLHIIIAQICAMFGFFVGRSLYKKLKCK